MTDQSLFVDVYDVNTRLKQRVPREWLDDPILGRDIRKTPSQRELDGDLPPRPAGDASAEEIGAFADAAGLDLSDAETEADQLTAIEDAMAFGSVQVGVVDEAAADPVDDPLAPEKVAHVDAPVPAPPATVPEPEGDELETDGEYTGDDWTFQALKDEIDARNADRDDDDRLSKGGSADDLRERLIADDAAQAETDEGASSSADDSTTSTDDTGSSEDTPAAGDEEN